MKIYGPFHALNNPLVIASIGLQGLDSLAHIYNEYKQNEGNDFVNRAALTGQPVTELEGGPFRKLASKVTGGFISPNEKASEQDLVAEQGVLQGQQKQRLSMLNTMAELHNKLPIGTKMDSVMGAGFGGAGPFTKSINWNNLSQDQERKQLADQKIRLEIDNLQHPERKTAQKVADKAAIDKQSAIDATSPLGLAAIATRSRTAAEAAEPIRVRTAIEEAAGRTGIEKAGEFEKAFESHRGAVAGTAAGVEDLTTDQYTAKTGKIFIDNKTLTPIKTMRTKDASAMESSGAYSQIKQGKELQDLKSTKEAMARIDELRRPENLEKVFPKVNANASAKGSLLGIQGARNAYRNAFDPDVQKYARAQDILVAYFKATQGRYPSQVELQSIGAELIPQMGGAVHVKGIGVGQKSGHFRADSYEVAKDKLDTLYNNLKHRYLSDVEEHKTEDTTIRDDLKSHIPSEDGE